MKKTLDYLYIFSKLRTSFILLFVLLILGYFFYLSFKNQEISNNDQSELINKFNQNVESLSKLSKKIEITESSLDQLKTSIQNIKKYDQSKEVVTLNKKIDDLGSGLKNILVDLEEIKTSNSDQLELINKLKQNVENLSKLSKKIEITENSLNQLKTSIQNITNSDQSKEIA